MSAMQFSANNYYYRIAFKHELFEEKIARTNTTVLDPKDPDVQARTTCSIRSWPFGADPKDAEVIARGVVECSVKDHYNKEEGRKRALKRALSIAWPEPNFYWQYAYEAYGKRTQEPKGKKKAA